jgi:hypothetical protein
VEGFAKLFNTPKGVVPHSFIPVGHPAEIKMREDRYRADRVHQNHF